MRHVTVREVRALLPDIENALKQEHELLVTKHGRTVARIVPVRREARQRPDHADLRASIPPLDTPSEVVVREERDARG